MAAADVELVLDSHDGWHAGSDRCSVDIGYVAEVFV
jgi:hypothetical protein